MPKPTESPFLASSVYYISPVRESRSAMFPFRWSLFKLTLYFLSKSSELSAISAAPLSQMVLNTAGSREWLPLLYQLPCVFSLYAVLIALLLTVRSTEGTSIGTSRATLQSIARPPTEIQLSRGRLQSYAILITLGSEHKPEVSPLTVTTPEDCRYPDHRVLQT